MNKSRRTFIKQSLLATAGSMMVPNFLKAFENPQAMFRKTSDKILVVIQLSGGNDGLNTVVPYRNDLYYQYRPQLAIPSSKVLKATDEMGFHPSLRELQQLYDDGYLAILNNVGYPNPDRSHFRSMDIWHTASNANEYLNTGWIGRYLDSSCQSCNTAHQAIEIDDTLSLALKGESIKGMAMRNPKKVYDAVKNNFFRSVVEQNAPGEMHESSIHYLYKTMAETSSSADYIYQKTKVYKPSVPYPSNEFSNRLKTVSQLIHSGVDTRVYYVSLSGFDTHVRQAQQHEQLLKTYAEGIGPFMKDLEENGRLDDVLIMTFSEFGRRVSQNASGGTDHGTANNLFIMGNALKKKGIINDTPDLSKLDQGDLIHQVDFRSVYATLLNQWLEAPDKKILQGSFKVLDFI
ncbi:MAG: DUF1501 domain-containing protein [Bacteroidota bacterium]